MGRFDYKHLQNSSLTEFIYQVSPIGFLIIDSMGKILQFNPFFKNLFELQIEDAQGDLFIHQLPNLYSIGLLNRFQDCIQHLEPVASDCSFSGSDGKKKYIEYYFIPLEESKGNWIIQAVFIDLSKRKEEQEEVKKISGYFHNLLSGLSPVATLDTTYKVKFVNEPFLSEFLDDTISPIGQNIIDLFHLSTNDRKDFEKNLLLSQKSRVQNCEFSVGEKVFGYSIFRFENDIGIILKNITETRKLERRIEELYSQLLKSQEKERERISRDLHDSVGQTILAAKLNLSAFWKDPNRSEEKFQYALSLIDKTSQELREIYTNLYPPVLKELGLESAARSLLRGMFEEGFTIEWSYQIEAKLSFDLELTLYRILQEVCSNVVKHSKASALSIKIYSQDKNLYFTSSDNGIGLDMQELQWKGFGLQNMRRRIEDWKGKLEFESKPKKGFKINITIPNCI